jgi:hypothetical protein
MLGVSCSKSRRLFTGAAAPNGKGAPVAIYMIGYDLHAGQNYTDLEDAIKALSGDWWHCLDSTWLVRHHGTSAQIRDTLRKHIKSDDKLLVLVYSSGAAWYGFSGVCQDWLKSHL